MADVPEVSVSVAVSVDAVVVVTEAVLTVVVPVVSDIVVAEVDVPVDVTVSVEVMFSAQNLQVVSHMCGAWHVGQNIKKQSELSKRSSVHVGRQSAYLKQVVVNEPVNVDSVVIVVLPVV